MERVDDRSRSRGRAALRAVVALVGVSIAVAGPAVAQTDPTDPTVTTPTTVPSTTATTTAPPTTEAPPVTEAPPTTVATTVAGASSPAPTRAPQATTAPPVTVAEPEAEAEEGTSPEEAETTTTEAGPASPVSLAPEPEPEEVSKDEGGIGYQTRMNLIIGALLVVAAVVSVLTVLYWRHTRPGSSPSSPRPARPAAAVGSTGDAGEERAETVEDWGDGVEGVDWEYVEEEEWDAAWSSPEDSGSSDAPITGDGSDGPAPAQKVGIVSAEPSFVTAEDLRASGAEASDMVGRDG